MAASLTPREDRILTESRSSLDGAFRATFTEPCPLPVLSSDLQPDVTCEVDDADGHARLHVDGCPDWPAPKRIGKTDRFRGPYFRGARHQWALYSAGTAEHAELLRLRCPCCGTEFGATKCTGGWVVMCSTCTVDAASADDGGMPPCGQGATALEAAQNWSEA